MRTIDITNVGMRVRVTIRKSKNATSTHYFDSLDAAKEFVLLRGNRQTPCYLNGVKCVLAGWVMGATLGV